MVFRCTYYWPTGPKGFPLSQQDTQYTSPIAVHARSRVHAEKMANESRYIKTEADVSAPSRRCSACRGHGYATSFKYSFSPRTYHISSIIARRRTPVDVTSAVTVVFSWSQHSSINYAQRRSVEHNLTQTASSSNTMKQTGRAYGVHVIQQETFFTHLPQIRVTQGEFQDLCETR